MGAVAALTGISLFPFIVFMPYIILAHSHNYRFTCAPNIPDCLADDTLRWIQTYEPKTFDEYFPAYAAAPEGQKCPDNYLWSSVYLLARTPAKGFIEFALYQNIEYFNLFNDWAERTDLHDDCFALRIPHLAFIPASLYAIYGFSGIVSWAGSVVIKVATAIIPILSTVYALEKNE